MRMFNVNTKSQFLEYPSLSFDNLSFECHVLGGQKHGCDGSEEKRNGEMHNEEQGTETHSIGNEVTKSSKQMEN